MSSKPNNNKIILSGGGTGGSVTPLLAIAESLPENINVIWIGTHNGIERRMTAGYDFKYIPIAAGKFRRYFSLQNIIDIINIKIGFLQSLSILYKHKPKLVITAGGFVSVPVAWAAKILGIPVIIHQQDIRPGLANKLMAPCASIITTAFEKSLKDYGKNAIWIGNPIRSAFFSTQASSNKRTSILVLGGGTGSESINKLVKDSIEEIVGFADLVHITGKHNVKSELKKDINGYQSYDLLDTVHIVKAMTKADIVVTRAGLGTLSELSFLGKASVIIPIPDSHQEDNANYFKEHDAAIVLDQKALTTEAFISVVEDLSSNEAKRNELASNIKKAMKQGANEAMVGIIKKLIS